MAAAPLLSKVTAGTAVLAVDGFNEAGELDAVAEVYMDAHSSQRAIALYADDGAGNIEWWWLNADTQTPDTTIWEPVPVLIAPPPTGDPHVQLAYVSDIQGGDPVLLAFLSDMFAGDDRTIGFVSEILPPLTAPTAPAAPANVLGLPGNGEAALSWTAPTVDGGAAITDYVIQYSSNNGTDWTTFSDGVSTGTTAFVTGLTNGVTYVAQVAAVNSIGTSPYSAKSGPFVPTLPPGTGDPVYVGASSASATSTTLSVPLTGFTPAAGDDVFLLVETAGGGSSALTVSGFTALASPTATTSNKATVYHRRWLAGDNAATSIVVTRASSGAMHAKAVVFRNLLTTIASSSALLAAAAITASGNGLTTLTLGPSATPSQARYQALALLGGGGNLGGGLSASSGWTVGSNDTIRTMSARQFFTAAATQTVTLSWTTSQEALGVLLLLKAN